MLRALRTTSFRLAAIYVAVFAVSAFALGLTVYWAARSALKQQMSARIETEVTFLREEFRAGGVVRLVAVVRSRGRGGTALDYLVQAADGTRLVGEMPAVKALRPGWTTIDVAEAPEDGGRPEQVLALVTDLDRGLLLAVGDDLGRIDEIEEAITTAFSWTVGLAALLGITGGVFLSHAFLRRVDAITMTAEAIIAGDLARRVPVRGSGDDFDRLAATLNRMLDRIVALMTSLQQVSSDVAHDLRTPLNRLYQRLEDARMRSSSVAEYRMAVDAAVGEAEQLLDTFAALLRIAQVEGAVASESFCEVALHTICEAVVDAYGPDAEAGGRQLVARVTTQAVVRGDRELLTQVLANLVENTLNHTPPGTHIAVSLGHAADGKLRLSVSDDGPGVARSDMPMLTQRFYRTERSRTSPGNGLGLSLVHAVADLHGAVLLIEDARPGLCVSLMFADADG